jgi:hypothetical protein
MTMTMYDSIDITQIPADAQAAAGYVGGNWPTFAALAKWLPHAHLLSIAVNSGEDAQCLDDEPGDASNADVYTWFTRQLARGVWRPVLYTSVSNIDGLVATMTANGFSRGEYRLWSAHYTYQPHICGPATCRQTRYPCDGTQFTDRSGGKNLDQSVLLDSFFGTAAPAAPAATAIVREPDMLTATRPDGGTDIYVLRPNGQAVHVQKDTTGKTVHVETPPGTWEALVAAGWRDNAGTQQAYLEGIGTGGGDWQETWQAPETGWQQPAKLA